DVYKRQKQKAQSKDWAFCFICCLPGNAHRGRMSAINGQASNQSEARPHGRAFCVFIHEKLKHPE
ncbi:hypothetical protein, partial [Raoultella ornithinolytica]|uniref:hypothetical protein n=1 Tax=Raoultella ornithinolytica TaxID=54291 RepID=UPI0019812E3B